MEHTDNGCSQFLAFVLWDKLKHALLLQVSIGINAGACSILWFPMQGPVRGKKNAAPLCKEKGAMQAM